MPLSAAARPAPSRRAAATIERERSEGLVFISASPCSDVPMLTNGMSGFSRHCYSPTVLHFRPRLLDELRGYDRARLAADVSAGLTVAAVALPLAMAFAIASGLKPQAGLFTAIVAGFLISALGGSRVQIGGPAGAFVVIVYGIVQHHGVANLLLATMIAGVLLFLMGVFRLGNLVRFVPVTIVIGFTNGIAVLIIVSQLPDLFGLRVEQLPADFFLKLRALAQAAPSADPVTIALAAASLGVIWVWPRL